MPADFLAGERHFTDHLLPLWEALPEYERGAFCLAKSGQSSEPPEKLRAYAARRSSASVQLFENQAELLAFLKKRPGPVVTAAVVDLTLATRSGRPQIFCEHGAGQSYSNRHSSYAGGRRSREHVVLFLCPNEQAAQRNREHYPQTPVAVVGCPKLDVWHRQPPKPRERPPVIAVSFHWDCRVCPETRWAFPHYAPVLGGLRDLGPVIGHGHPRVRRRLESSYRLKGIEVVPDFTEVLQRADLYICDNSSTIFEFASVGRPVVLLNAPWYRRDVEHGLRFWEAAGIGLQVDQPEDLVETVRQALSDPPQQREKRKQAVQLAYAYTDGQATERAVTAIMEVVRQANG